MSYIPIPSGSLQAFAGSTAPAGWLLCDGSAVSRTIYGALFSAISTAWGYGDNSTTFNLPDLRGRFLRGRDAGIARDPDRATRTAANTGGNTGDAVGSIQGVATKIPNTSFTTAAQALSGGNAISVGHSHGTYTQTTVFSYPGVPSWGPSDGSYGTFGGGDHGHSVTGTCPASTVNGGGDSETRPLNANVNYIIKI
jgi:phage-related tail fiber protein